MESLRVAYLDKIDALKHYTDPKVKREIFDYSFRRWVAVYMRGGKSEIFLRYIGKDERPITFESMADYDSFLRRYWKSYPRTFYASVNVYKGLKKKDDVEDPANILAATPIWDIDGALEHVPEILEAARIIVDALEREGVVKSVYLVWSGRGIHVQINEKAFSQEVLSKHHPLDVAYAVVDYILSKVEDKLVEVAKKALHPERPLKVENEIDMKRVFTIPLSLHRKVDFVAVCFKPEDIDSFELEWAKPGSFKHRDDWRKYEEGEADELALKAIREVGGYFQRTGEIRKVVGFQKPRERKKEKEEKRPVVREGGKIGRFQVMALLQAARYYLLTGDMEKAKSFGLNRAIFYAWAKHHGRARAIIAKAKVGKPVETVNISGKKAVRVGNEVAFVSDRGWFMMGDQEQRPEDFDKNVKEKIEQVIPFEVAWEAAINYLKKFPKSVLLDQRSFFEVYEKVRDNFIEKVVMGKDKEKSLLDFFK